MSKHIYTLLCLGDSYTIGEGVALHESFPYQTVQLLRDKGFHFHAPEIVAKTSWTTFELAEHILHHKLNEQYDFVTLLVGVNNQYRGLGMDEFANEFEFLLKKAIHLANNHTERVIVLSIPDWGVTPFAKDRNAVEIHDAIDAFNATCESLAAKHETHYVDITASTRKAKDDTSLLTGDQLHYAAKEMQGWVKSVASIIQQELALAAN